MSAKNKGFTFIEILVIVIIISFLISVGMIKYVEMVRKARVTQCRVNRTTIEDAEQRYYYANNESCLNISKLVEDGYLNKMPVCAAGGQYVWISTFTNSSVYPLVGCSVHYWFDSESEMVTELLFSHDFNNMDSLTSLRGDWYIADGTLRPTVRGGEHRLVFGELDWTDYTIEVEAILHEGRGYGIYYRSDGEERISGYCFQYNPGDRDSFLVRRVFNGREESPFQRVSMPEGFSVYGQSHTISITVDGNNHTISVDGRQIMDFNDNAFSSGMAGFSSWGHSEVSFDQVNVYEN